MHLAYVSIFKVLCQLVNTAHHPLWLLHPLWSHYLFQLHLLYLPAYTSDRHCCSCQQRASFASVSSYRLATLHANFETDSCTPLYALLSNGQQTHNCWLRFGKTLYLGDGLHFHRFIPIRLSVHLFPNFHLQCHLLVTSNRTWLHGKWPFWEWHSSPR